MNRDELITSNMNLVYSLIAKEFPKHIGDEDLIQCGMVGLCRAAERWDESKSEFSTFAWTCIRYEILKEFRSRKKHYGVLSLDYVLDDGEGGKTTVGDLLPGEEDVSYINIEPLLEQLNPIQLRVYELKKSGASNKEIAKELGVTVQRVQQIQRRVQALWRMYVDSN